MYKNCISQHINEYPGTGKKLQLQLMGVWWVVNITVAAKYSVNLGMMLDIFVINFQISFDIQQQIK